MLQNDSFRNLKNVLNMEYYVSKKKSRLGCLLTLLLAAVVVAAMVFTCPDSRRHKEVVTNVMTETLNDMSASGSAADDLLTHGIRVVGDLLVGNVAETAIDKMLTVDNYFVCSIGKIHYDGKDHVVSAGILGHVFTINKEDLTKAAEKYYRNIRQEAEDAIKQQIRENVVDPIKDQLKEQVIAPIDEALGGIFNDIMGGQPDGTDEPGRSDSSEQSDQPDNPDPSSESNL